jgi:SNF2 family DNA or RNA helicase
MVQEWNEGKVPVMLLHPASAGHGLNLQDGGSTLIWYTVPYSLEHWIQTNGRLDRMGQKNPVTIYRLITKGTHDTRLPVNLERKRLVQEGLISAVHVDAQEFEALAKELAEDIYDLNASIF